MRALRFAFLLLTGTAAYGGAAPDVPKDPVLDRLALWARRAHEELRLAGAPPPHRVVIAMIDGVGYRVNATFGALVDEEPKRLRQGSVEVVVGSDALDSSRFDARGGRWAERAADPRQEMTVAVEQGESALERDLWLATDASYKKAVQRWQAKVAARAAAGEESAPPDWSPAEASVAVNLDPLEAPPAERLRRLALELSAELGSVASLDQAEVFIGAVDSLFYTATSEGTRIAQPESYAVIKAEAELQRPDGVTISDELQWVAIDSEHLPGSGALREAVRELGLSVARRARAADVDYYEGPVVFEDHAAAQFFRHLIPPEISGTPPEPQPGRSYRHQTRKGPRLGRRLLPDGWSVTDDPSAAPEGQAGGYRYDRQGVLARRVGLVEDGFVRALLMSRVPRVGLDRSTGHARGPVWSRWVARPAIWRVAPARPLDDAAFDLAVRELHENAQLERILLIRRMGNERDGRLPAPTHAVWLYADGREVPVSLLEFENVDRRTLRSVVAAGGGETVVGYLAAFDPEDWPLDDRGLPTVVTAPRRLLVEDMELVFPGPASRPRSYPRPPTAD